APAPEGPTYRPGFCGPLSGVSGPNLRLGATNTCCTHLSDTALDTRPAIGAAGGRGASGLLALVAGGVGPRRVLPQQRAPRPAGRHPAPGAPRGGTAPSRGPW